MLAGELKGPDVPSVDLEAEAPDVKAEGGSLTGKLAAGAATIGAGVGAIFATKGSGKADVEVRRSRG